LPPQIECATDQDDLGISSECFFVARIASPHCGEILCKCFKAMKDGPGIGAASVKDCLDRLRVDYEGLRSEAEGGSDYVFKVKLTQCPQKPGALEADTTMRHVVMIKDALHEFSGPREQYRFGVVVGTEIGAVPIKLYGMEMYELIMLKMKVRSLDSKVTVLGSMLKVAFGKLYVYTHLDLGKLKDACMWPRITDDPSVLATFLPLVSTGKYEPEIMPSLADERFGEVSLEALRDRVGSEIAARFLAEREAGQLAQFGGPCFDKVVRDTRSKLQHQLTKLLDGFLNKSGKYRATVENVRTLMRTTEEIKARVLNEDQAKDSAVEAVAEAAPAKSALAALAAGPVPGVRVYAYECEEVKERPEHVFDRVEGKAQLYEERCEKEGPSIKEIYARTAWRAVKGKGVLGEVAEFEKLPADVAAYVWAVPGV
jgi:hypothetical protein